MKLSEYFTLQELTHSQTATRKGLDNTPGPEALANLTKLAKKLDEVRRLLGRPVYISSGYRSLALNKAIGGSRTSSHTAGLAADFSCPGFGKTMDVFEKIRNSGIHYDQLIAEFPASPTGGWVHLGIGPADRREALIYDGKRYRRVP